jgi:hypothetical protein
MNEHYSTAEKIIGIVKNKLILALSGAKHPEIIRAYKEKYVEDFTACLADQRNLAQQLGDILKEKLPKDLYAKYQRLKENEKQELREKIATAYFLLLKSCIENLENIDIKISIREERLYGKNVEMTISLPEEFIKIDKDKLTADLDDAISSVREKLFAAENEIVHFKSPVFNIQGESSN